MKPQHFDLTICFMNSIQVTQLGLKYKHCLQISEIVDGSTGLRLCEILGWGFMGLRFILVDENG